MIECENCILEKAVYACEADCVALEDALKEHDKQIREEVLLKFAKHLLDYDTPITSEDVLDELCFFIDRDELEQMLKEYK